MYVLIYIYIKINYSNQQDQTYTCVCVYIYTLQYTTLQHTAIDCNKLQQNTRRVIERGAPVCMIQGSGFRSLGLVFRV